MTKKYFQKDQCKNCGGSIKKLFKGGTGWRHFKGNDFHYGFHYHCHLPDSVKLDTHAEPKISVEKGAEDMDPAGAPIIRQALQAMVRNIEIAADFGSGQDPDLLASALSKILEHRTEVAIRMLVARREPQDDGVIKELHDLFDYDQDQIRQLLGLITED